MLNILILINITLSVILIILILINKGKGSDSGGIINSYTNSFFGNKETISILNKIITVLAFFLFVITIFITIINNKNFTKENEPVIKIIKTKI